MKAPTSGQWLRAAAVRLAVGTERLALHLSRRLAARVKALYERIRDWLSSSTGLSWWVKVALLVVAFLLLRKIVTSIGGGIYRRIESGAWSWMLWPSLLLWLIAAYRAGRPGWTPKSPAAAAAVEPQPKPEESTSTTSDTAEQAPAGPPPVSPVALVAAVRDIGTPHAQLKPLADHLRTTTDAVRAAAAEQGWPLKDVRMQGRSASAGLAWPPPPLPPLSGVVGADQHADDNDDDSASEGAEKGLRVEAIGQGGRLVRDPSDTIRHHKITNQESRS